MSEDATWGFYEMHSTPTRQLDSKDIRITRSPLPPMRSIRRVTCLHQLAATNNTLVESSAAMVLVPPLPKHTPTHLSLPAMPAGPLRDVNTGRLLEKIGILNHANQSVVVTLKHQWLSWQQVDESFRQVNKYPKQKTLLTQDSSVIQVGSKSWMLVTNHGSWRFDCPSSATCSTWIETCHRILASLSPPSVPSTCNPPRIVSAPIRIANMNISRLGEGS